MLLKILNIVVKCSRSFFLKAPLQLLKRTKIRTRIFLVSTEIISMLKCKKVLIIFSGFRFPKYKNSFLFRKYKIFFRDFRLLKYEKFSRGGFFFFFFFFFLSLKSYFLKYKKIFWASIS